MTQEEMIVKREDLYKSWGYEIEKLPFGAHMWLEPEKNTSLVITQSNFK